jgi:hypothetical protein
MRLRVRQGQSDARAARARTLVDQLRARAVELVDQVDKLQQRADAQYAAATSSR